VHDLKRWKVAAAAVVGLILVAGLLALTRRGDDNVSDRPSSSPSLFDTKWRLSGMSAEGSPVVLTDVPPVEWVFVRDHRCDDQPPNCYTGSGLAGNDTCNGFERDVHIDGDTGTWGTYWWTTAAACSGALADAFAAFMQPASFSYTLSGRQLRLTAGGTELTFAGPG
jgi:hypothetical protein